MQKRYNTDEAVEYLGKNGFKTTKGTLNVWRCRKQGPEYIKLRTTPLYEQEALDNFLNSGVRVKTLDSTGAR